MIRCLERKIIAVILKVENFPLKWQSYSLTDNCCNTDILIEGEREWFFVPQWNCLLLSLVIRFAGVGLGGPFVMGYILLCSATSSSSLSGLSLSSLFGLLSQNFTAQHLGVDTILMINQATNYLANLGGNEYRTQLKDGPQVAWMLEQSQARVVSDSSNEIHQTWGPTFRQAR